MHGRADSFLEGILGLDRYAPADRRRVFRQSIASLAALVLASTGESPLEGCDPDALARSVRVALEGGLVDDLGWLAAAAAGVTLYEIASALPSGPEKREIGRRAAGHLYEGNAATFAAIATRMALGSGRGLSGSAVRARVALAMSLPSHADVPVDPLALALVSRRELAADWLGRPAGGSLPERRLAARLLERAAREAAARARQGDDTPLRIFLRALGARHDGGGGRRAERETLESAYASLLGDRETLVWRHVAAARGLLAGAAPGAYDQIRAALVTGLTPTEWRRGATSLVASIAVVPDLALPAALELVRGPLLARDPGIATAMLWGAPRAAEAEPEAVEELLDAIARAAPLYVAESLVELRFEVGDIGRAAGGRCAAALAASLERGGADPDVVGLARTILHDLSSDAPAGPETTRVGRALRAAIGSAVDAFVEVGTREAHARALGALGIAEGAVERLEAIPLDANGAPAYAAARSTAAMLVRELDTQLFESGVLKYLLLLSRRPSDSRGGMEPIDDLDERIGRWLLVAESTPTPASNDPSPPHATMHLRQLRALLHLIDGEASDFDDEPSRRARVHDRWATAARRLIARLSQERPSPLRRAIAATVARALDALVRDGAADPADILLYAARRVTDANDLPVLAEASMHPDVSMLLHAYARFTSGRAAAPMVALEAFVAELPSGATQRIEGLRAALARLGRALRGVESATSLRPLADSGSSPLGQLDEALERLRQLTTSALRRCGDELADVPSPSVEAAYPIALAAGRAVQPGASVEDELGPSIRAVVRRAYVSLPHALAEVVGKVLPGVASLPVDEPSHEEVPFLLRQPSRKAPPAAEVPLPAWLPSRRTIGGFYVHRPIGGGAAGTVFVVTRTEERHDPNAERFALKVPDYDATAARSLSEADFLQLFREEAGALLAIPEHRNLARFVTFDAGARPKPILVMELVEGARCDRLVESRLLDLPRALALLDGVLAGLEAMHSVGVGHLDIKPSNVVLRDGREPVLVDFGLAGRHLRPGCGTGAYGAPEIWVGTPDGSDASPLPADIYSFGCFAYEVLTAETLFDGPNDVALVAAHLTHDGMPRPLQRLAESRGGADLAALLQRCLRKRPADRAAASEVRAGLQRLAVRLEGRPWPLAPS